MENNINSNNDLEQLRSQMSLLQHKLEHQEIVNDSLIRKSMKDRMQWIKVFIILEALLMAPFCVIVSLFFKLSTDSIFNISWAWFVVLTLLLVVDIVIDYRVNVTALKDSDFNRDSLNNTIVKLVKMKKARMLQAKWGLAFLIAVFVWFLIEAWLTVAPGEEAHYLLICLTVGVVIGSIIGSLLAIYIVKRMQRTNDELINQIREVTSE